MKHVKCPCGKQFEYTLNGYTKFKDHFDDDMGHMVYPRPDWSSKLYADIMEKAMDLFRKHYGSDKEL